MCWTSGELVAYARSRVEGHVARCPRAALRGQHCAPREGLKDDPKRLTARCLGGVQGAAEQSLDLELEKPPAAERVREAARNVNHTRRGAWQRWAVEEMRLAGLRRG